MVFELKNEDDQEVIDVSYPERSSNHFMIAPSDDERSRTKSERFDKDEVKSTVSSLPDVFKPKEEPQQEQEREPEAPKNSIWGFSNLLNKSRIKEHDSDDEELPNKSPDFLKRRQSGYSSAGSMFRQRQKQRDRKQSFHSRGSRESFPAFRTRTKSNRSAAPPRKHGNVNFRKRELLNELRDLVDNGYIAHNTFDIDDSIDEISTEVDLGQLYFQRLSTTNIVCNVFYKLAWIIEKSTLVFNPLNLDLTGFYAAILASKKSINYEIRLIVNKWISNDSIASSPEFRLFGTIISTILVTHFNNTVQTVITDKIKQPGGLQEIIGAVGPMLSQFQQAAATSMGRSPPVSSQTPQSTHIPRPKPTPVNPGRSQQQQQPPTPEPQPMGTSPDIVSIFSQILPKPGSMPHPKDTRADDMPAPEIKIPKKVPSPPASIDSGSVITLEPNTTLKPKRSKRISHKVERKTYDI